MLTEKQVNDYKDQGYLVIENFVSAEECDRLRYQMAQIISESDLAENASVFATGDENTKALDDYFLDSGDKIRFFYEKGVFDKDGQLNCPAEQALNKVGHAMHDLDSVFSEFSRQEKIKNLMTGLGVKEPLLAQSMYIFKHPKIGGEIVNHQDATFLFTDPVSVVGLLFYLEDATLENGCLQVVPGGHKTSLRSRFVRKNGSTEMLHLDEPLGNEGLVPVEVSKGSLIVAHGLLPHGSGSNTSEKSRHSYSLHIIDGETHYPEDNWLVRPVNNPFKGF